MGQRERKEESVDLDSDKPEREREKDDDFAYRQSFFFVLNVSHVTLHLPTCHFTSHRELSEGLGSRSNCNFYGIRCLFYVTFSVRQNLRHFWVKVFADAF